MYQNKLQIEISSKNKSSVLIHLLNLLNFWAWFDFKNVSIKKNKNVLLDKHVSCIRLLSAWKHVNHVVEKWSLMVRLGFFFRYTSIQMKSCSTQYCKVCKQNQKAKQDFMSFSCYSISPDPILSDVIFLRWRRVTKHIEDFFFWRKINTLLWWKNIKLEERKTKQNYTPNFHIWLFKISKSINQNESER